MNTDQNIADKTKDNRLTVLSGHVIDKLAEIAAGSVQCVVTSPPYWGLRSYLPKGHPLKHLEIGQEKTPQDFVNTMLAVFGGKENPVGIWRALREDGTVWLNLGDSYAGSPVGTFNGGSQLLVGRDLSSHETGAKFDKLKASGLKQKDLIGIPWRVALALQAAGWYLRSDIIWTKPNCMPESVTDRPTRSHEYLFLLTKSPRYFYDAEAIKEPVSENTHARVSQDVANQVGSYRANGGNKTNGPMKAVIAGSSRKIAGEGQGKRNASYEQAMCLQVGSRNKRSVWWISPGMYSEAHFATFPPELIKPCILAGTSAGGACRQCGSPLRREIEKGQANEEHRKACGADANGEYNGKSTKNHAAHGVQDASAVKARILEGMRERKTVGWEPTCKCKDSLANVGGTPPDTRETRVLPCIVLDPFGGSGTTGEVALELGRRAILIELNPNYLPLIEQRTNITPGLAI